MQRNDVNALLHHHTGERTWIPDGSMSVQASKIFSINLRSTRSDPDLNRGFAIANKCYKIISQNQ